MNDAWRDGEFAQDDIVMTFGRFFTDAAAHSLTTIPGEVTFSFDARSHSGDVPPARAALAHEDRRGVRAKNTMLSSPGRRSVTAIRRNWTPRCVAHCSARAKTVGIEPVELASGPGHDAQDFAEAGIPSAMLFIRNSHGSHNRHEHMEMADFRRGVKVLFAFVNGIR